MTVAITPTLFIGDEAPDLPHERVDNVEDAVRVIDALGHAVLPDGAWSLAADVLRELGYSESWIENRLHYAQTGVVLPIEDDDL